MLIAFLLAITGIRASALVHDSVPSTIRAGVASGVSTIAWTGFVPFALAFGWVTRELGVATSGWMLTATAAMVGTVLVHLALRRPGVAAQQEHTHAVRVEPVPAVA